MMFCVSSQLFLLYEMCFPCSFFTSKKHSISSFTADLGEPSPYSLLFCCAAAATVTLISLLETCSKRSVCVFSQTAKFYDSLKKFPIFFRIFLCVCIQRLEIDLSIAQRSPSTILWRRFYFTIRQQSRPGVAETQHCQCLPNSSRPMYTSSCPCLCLQRTRSSTKAKANEWWWENNLRLSNKYM